MNYLAHAYLSFADAEVLVGNMMSDFVKGKTKFDFAPAIQVGIALHRDIDSFTDSHPVIKYCKTIYQPAYRLYSGAFVDVTMDHFLAIKLSKEANLLHITQKIYEQLEQYENVFPPVFKKMFPHMKLHNWLYNYQFNWGIEKSFIGLQKRAAYIEETATAFDLFEKNHSFFEHQFSVFWNELYQFSFERYSILKNSFLSTN